MCHPRPNADSALETTKNVSSLATLSSTGSSDGTVPGHEATDSVELAAGERRVGVGQESVSREVGRVGVHRRPPLDEGTVLEAQVGVV